MLTMVGRTLRSTVVNGVLVGLCLSGPLHAGQNQPVREPQQSQREEQDRESLRRAAEQGDTDAQATVGAISSGGLVLPPYVAETVWHGLGPEQGHPSAKLNLASAQLNLGVLLENFDVHNGPVPYGAPSHAEMIAVTTPLAFSTPAAITFPVIGWTRRGR